MDKRENRPLRYGRYPLRDIRLGGLRRTWQRRRTWGSGANSRTFLWDGYIRSFILPRHWRKAEYRITVSIGSKVFWINLPQAAWDEILWSSFTSNRSKRRVSFLPTYNNEHVCPDARSGEPSTCDIGFRSVVVARGWIRTKGLPCDCKTWMELEDVLPTRKASHSQRIHHPRHFTQLPQVDVNHPNPIICPRPFHTR